MAKIQQRRYPSRGRPALEVVGQLSFFFSTHCTTFSSLGMNVASGARSFFANNPSTKNPVQQADRGPARSSTAFSPPAAQKSAGVPMRENEGRVHLQELAAPYGHIGSQTGAVPGDAEDGAVQVVVGHARQYVGIVMLDLDTGLLLSAAY